MLKKVIALYMSSIMLFGMDLSFKALFNIGGEELAKFSYTDGSSQSIYAHQGEEIGLGLNIELLPFIDWETTAGMAFGGVKASNGTAMFFRFPMETLLQLNLGFLRIGGGVSYHVAPQFSCQATGVCSISNMYTDALGYTAEGLIVIDRHKEIDADITFGVKYTWINYSIGSLTADGSGYSVLVGYLF